MNNIENQSHPDENSLNNNLKQENLIDFPPDLPITNPPEIQGDTQHIIESEIALVEEMSEQVLPAEDGEFASDIPRRKPCFGWIGDGEDD